VKEALLVATGGAAGAFIPLLHALNVLTVSCLQSSRYMGSECYWEFRFRLAVVFSLESNSYPTELAIVGWG
jgi:hypothetical protein